jgi:hypothetical protein
MTYDARDLRRIESLAGGPLLQPEDIRRVIDKIDYLDDWRSNYEIKSVKTSLHSPKITCIDAAILAYGLLEFMFPQTPRKLLALHRRDKHGEECGHCVALYWRGGKVGSFSKSSYPGLGHREAVFKDGEAVALSYAAAYMKMEITPLYYGITTLEEAAPDIDWRRSKEPVTVVCERLQAHYSHGFGQAA